MKYKIIILASILGLVVTQLFIYEFKNDPNEYTELNFVCVKKEAVTNDGYTIYFDTPVKTEDRVFSYNNEWYTILEYSKETALLAAYPKKIASNEQFTFSFEITNHLGHAWEYRYSVVVDEEIVEEGTLSAENTEKRVIQESLRIDSPGRHKVSIRLSTGEEIHFYIDVT